MGAYTSCIRPHIGSAMVIPSDRSAPERWELPAEAIDVMLEHPSYEVVDAMDFLETGRKKPMLCSAPLKAKRVYFLVPNNQEGPEQDDDYLQMQVHSLQNIFGRAGMSRIVPLRSGVGAVMRRDL